MSAQVGITNLNLVVLGQVQYSFSVGGVGGYSLSGVLVPCCAQRGVALDGEVQLLSQELRKRAKKLENLGYAMSQVSYIIGAINMLGKDKATETAKYPDDVTDKVGSASVNDIERLAALVEPYGLTYQKIDASGKVTEANASLYKDILYPAAYTKKHITKSDAEIVQSTVKLAVDKENNVVKQTSNSLQSFLSKRDDAYELIGKLEKKINKTASTTVGAIGS